MSCEACEVVKRFAEQLSDVEVVEHRADEVYARGYIAGFAQGFMISKSSTYGEYCAKHAEMLRHELLARGAKPIPISSGGVG